MHQALARKYRPRTFGDVAVQSHVSQTLQGAIARGRVAHGYLLCGPRGVGKTTLARVLAMALNCDRRIALVESGAAADPGTAGEPCGVCVSCQRIWSGSASLDVVEIDAASNRGVDDARELRERAMYAPSGDERYKVYIVDEAHMLTREAWNALLKILEEPPPRVVFVFATTEPQKIAQAAAPVLSRLQRFDLKRIGAAEIRERLATVLAAESIVPTDEALAMLARAADGSMRDALSLTDQVLSLGAGDVTAGLVREALGLIAEDEYVALLRLIAERRAGDVFPAVARLADAGADLGALLGGLAEILRAHLSLSLGGGAEELSESARSALGELREMLPAGDALRMLNAVTELEPRFRRSGQQRILIETLLVRFALLDRSVSLEEVLRGLNGGESGERGGGSRAPHAPPGAPPRPSSSGGPGGGRAAPSASPRTPPGGERSAPVSEGSFPATAATTFRASPGPDTVSGSTGNAATASHGPAPAPGSTGNAATASHAPAPAPGSPGNQAMASGATGSPSGAIRQQPHGPPAAHQPATGARGPAPASGGAAGAPTARNGGAAVRPAPHGTIPYVPTPVAAGPSGAESAGGSRAVPELNTLVERWDDVVGQLRAAGRATVANALASSLPVSVTASGIVTVQLDEDADLGYELVQAALEAASADVMAAIGAVAGAAVRIVLTRPEGATDAPVASRRMTAETIRGERMESLRRGDHVLAAAIDELDLELLD